MCLLLFAYQSHPQHRLVLVANRDEFYERPTAPAAFWEDASGVLAGRDLKSGGTWLGVSRSGGLAALTNFREPGNEDAWRPSRGVLVANFLRGDKPPEAYLAHMQRKADLFNGFNLIVGDAATLYYFSNREGVIRRLGAGVYGISNHLLDTPWPKVTAGKAHLRRLLADGAPIDPETLLDLVADPATAPDEALPDTGVGLEWERVLSAMFIQSPIYGTRTTTALLFDYDGQVTFVERTYDHGHPQPARRFTFVAEPAERLA